MDNHELKDKSLVEQQAEELFDNQMVSGKANDTAPYVVQYADKIPLYIVSPSSAVRDLRHFEVAQSRLSDYGFEVSFDPEAKGKVKRFAGTDAKRAAAFSRDTLSFSEDVMCSHGG